MNLHKMLDYVRQVVVNSLFAVPSQLVVGRGQFVFLPFPSRTVPSVVLLLLHNPTTM